VQATGPAPLAGVAARGRAVIYALGGGFGHLSRALALARIIDVTAILHRASGALPDVDVPSGVRLIGVDAAWTPARLRACLAGLAHVAPVLVVDTFPGGVAHELDGATLAGFAHRVLVRRYLRPGAYDGEAELAARFDVALVPYRRGLCEWADQGAETPAGAPAGEPGDAPGADGCACAGEHVGFLVRELGVVPGPAALELAVIGDAARLPPGWRSLLPGRTGHVSGPFRALPAARRYLAMGAGHNLVYELALAGVSFAAVPCERRYDDQFRRADRLGIGIHSRAELARWLAQPAAPLAGAGQAGGTEGAGLAGAGEQRL
jgi:hypothetical protein